MDNALGTFPLTGPVTYLTDDARECRTLLQGARPPSRTWFHGTIEQIARIVCVQGIVPGCWLRDGSGACGVMGYDAPADFLQRRRHLWVIEIVGPALEGDLKTWWVPVQDIRGVWRMDSFVPREEIQRTFRGPLVDCRLGCACGLSEICVEQQALWKGTWAKR